MSCLPSWAYPAMLRPGAVAAPVLHLCAGSRLRPLAFGYLRLRPNDPSRYATRLTAQLYAFALRPGLALADIYTEHPDTPSRDGAVLCALVDALDRSHLRMIVMPGDGSGR